MPTNHIHELTKYLSTRKVNKKKKKNEKYEKNKNKVKLSNKYTKTHFVITRNS